MAVGSPARQFGAEKNVKKKAAGRKVMARSWELTVFLMKETVTTWQDALVQSKRKHLPPYEDIDGVGSLVVKEAPETEPQWVKLLKPYSQLVSKLKQRSPGAVLFVMAKKRLFALTFGYGRSLLAPDRLVHDFGMRVVLNSVDPSRLRSLDLRTLEADPLLSRKQFGGGHPLASFGLDTYRDLLRGVAGSPGKDKPLRSGSDALHLRLPVGQPSDLRVQCATLLKLASAKKYQADFGWIDHIRLVRDSTLKLQMQEALFSECQTGAGDVQHLVADVRDGHQLERLRGSWAPRSEFAVDSGVVRLRLKSRASKARDARSFIDALKKDRVGEGSLETGELTQSWPLYDCLLWTVEVGQKRYILTSGDWFEVDGAFIASVEATFDSIVGRPSPLKLPNATKLSIPPKSYYEREYNAKASKTAKLTNLDRTSMMTGLGASGMEPCDLLDPGNGIFVHVKDGRSSAMLSHLFNQGVLSLETFLSLEGARAAVRKTANLPNTGTSPLHDPIAPSRLTVVFGIIDKAPSAGVPWRLPFFSMLAAKFASERIERLQARARIVRINDLRL